MRIIPVLTALLTVGALTVSADNRDAWYTEGDNAHTTRIEITLVNTLDIARKDCPVTVPREILPIRDINEMAVTVVDPSLPARPMPPDSVLKWQGGHNIREEANGQQLFYQCDDLDKDGVWDELFFITDLKPKEQKKMYLYIGFNQRGWNPHSTHAAIGSYCHHLIPVWESEHVGWKLWYTDTCDVYGKRKPRLMSTELYMKNRNGYGVDFDDGSDIMRVANTFGGGAICLFEHAAYPDSVSRPRFAPYDGVRTSHNNWNEGPLNDTRYAYDVIVNGPLRSIIRAKTMNWDTGNGEYELEQYYTSYTRQSYSTCTVRYKTFLPRNAETVFGCGIRKNAMEFDSYVKDNVAITFGKDELTDPDDDLRTRMTIVDFVGCAIAVKDEYKPEYRYVAGFGGNHTISVPITDDKTYEYMLLASWSEGQVYNTPESFKEYVLKSVREYNNPVDVEVVGVDKKLASR